MYIQQDRYILNLQYGMKDDEDMWLIFIQPTIISTTQTKHNRKKNYYTPHNTYASTSKHSHSLLILTQIKTQITYATKHSNPN